MKTLSILTECTVDRSKWLRGEGACNSRLLRSSDGKMCCLGQFYLQAGASESDIKGLASPMAVMACELPNHNTLNVMSEAMAINDTTELEAIEREVKLQRLFLTFTPPVRLTFIN